MHVTPECMGVCACGRGMPLKAGVLKVKEVGVVQDPSYSVLCVFPILDHFLP